MSFTAYNNIYDIQKDKKTSQIQTQCGKEKLNIIDVGTGGGGGGDWQSPP